MSGRFPRQKEWYRKVMMTLSLCIKRQGLFFILQNVEREDTYGYDR